MDSSASANARASHGCLNGGSSRSGTAARPQPWVPPMSWMPDAGVTRLTDASSDRRCRRAGGDRPARRPADGSDRPGVELEGAFLPCCQRRVEHVEWVERPYARNQVVFPEPVQRAHCESTGVDLRTL